MITWWVSRPSGANVRAVWARDPQVSWPLYSNSLSGSPGGDRSPRILCQFGLKVPELLKDLHIPFAQVSTHPKNACGALLRLPGDHMGYTWMLQTPSLCGRSFHSPRVWLWGFFRSTLGQGSWLCVGTADRSFLLLHSSCFHYVH